MSASVVPFTGPWQGGATFERSVAEQRADAKALRDARLLREAKRDGDCWQSQLLLAIFGVLDTEQRRKVEARLAVRRDCMEAEQALAIVHFRFGCPEHCGRVAEMLSRMNPGEA
jgi:hypothetical protein